MPSSSRYHDAAFTWVELLVLVTVVTLLGVMAARAAQTEDLQRMTEVARQRGALACAKGLFSAMNTIAMDHKLVFPDAPTSTAIFQQLIDEKVMLANETDILVIRKMEGKSRRTGDAKLTAANVSWDVTGRNDPATGKPFGFSAEDTDGGLPLIISTGNTPDLKIEKASAPGMTVTLAPTNVFGKAGLVVAYTSGSTQFLKADEQGKVVLIPETYADPRTFTVRNP